MSISPDLTQDQSLEEQAKGLLRARGNPFELLASPHRATAGFADLHAPEIHRLPREQLLAAIDTYRVPEYHDFARLPSTRVITVLGERGSGKTHLLQALIARADNRVQLVVRPSTLEQSLGFEEYLLAQIRIALGESDEFHGQAPLDLIAQSLTRRLLLQALRQLSPIQQLFALHPDTTLPTRLLWGGAEQSIRRWGHLLAKLADPTADAELRSIVLGQGLDPKQAVRLVEAHLRRLEASTSPLQVVRRGLYAALVRRVLLNDREILPQYLREDYLHAGGPGSTRSELVRPLLQVLVEACALCRIPIVFAFDNFERLFSPMGSYDSETAQKFFRNVAQVVDLPLGTLFLLFFEHGLFDAQGAPQIDDFVRGRIEQGVQLPNRESVSAVRLQAPDVEDLTCLIHGRVQRLLSDLPGASQLRRSFPFAERFPAQLAGSGVTLRNILIGLRDAYYQLLRPAALATPLAVPTEPAASQPASTEAQPNWTERFESIWRRATDASRRGVQEAAYQEYHEGLGVLLQALGGTIIEGWSIQRLLPVDPVGDHPTYGLVTRIDLRRADGASVDGPKELKVGVGFLLAARRGTLVDLRAKFDYFRKYERGARLVILWPNDAAGDLLDSMSDGTLAVWEENRRSHHKTQLRRIAERDLRYLLCLRLLPRYLSELPEQPPGDLLAEFLRSRLSTLLPLLVPPSNATE